MKRAPRGGQEYRWLARESQWNSVIIEAIGQRKADRDQGGWLQTILQRITREQQQQRTESHGLSWKENETSRGEEIEKGKEEENKKRLKRKKKKAKVSAKM